MTVFLIWIVALGLLTASVVGGLLMQRKAWLAIGAAHVRRAP